MQKSIIISCICDSACNKLIRWLPPGLLGCIHLTNAFTFFILATFCTFFVVFYFVDFQKHFWNHRNELTGLDFVMKLAEYRAALRIMYRAYYVSNTAAATSCSTWIATCNMWEIICPLAEKSYHIVSKKLGLFNICRRCFDIFIISGTFSTCMHLSCVCFSKSFMLSTLGFTCVAFVAGALALWAPKYMSKSLMVKQVHSSDTSWVNCALISHSLCCTNQLLHLHSDDDMFMMLDIEKFRASECPAVKNYKWWLNLFWHRMPYSCTHMWQQWPSKG